MPPKRRQTRRDKEEEALLCELERKRAEEEAAARKTTKPARTKALALSAREDRLLARGDKHITVQTVAEGEQDDELTLRTASAIESLRRYGEGLKVQSATAKALLE
jgi:hypothetical protein